MKRKSAVTLVFGSTIIALGMLAAGAQKKALHDVIQHIITAKNANYNYRANIVSHRVLPSCDYKNTKFLELQGFQQITNVITAYYSAAWNTYDSQQKLKLRALIKGMSLDTLTTSATGLTQQQIQSLIQQQQSLLPDLPSALPVLFKTLGIESLAHLLISIPYLLLTALTIPQAKITTILLALNKNARFTKDSLYRNKQYKSLKPLFDACDRRIARDWRRWNTDITTQKEWFNRVIEKLGQ
jgi:hypothetical protein